MKFKKVICLTLFSMFVSLSRSHVCKFRNSRNEIEDVCCADYEKRENVCIMCSKGYTSDTGQNCKPCLKNYYGERCRNECFCSEFEVCDNVEGCVQLSSTTGTSMYATSDKIEQRFSEKTCNVKTESGAIKKVCCADSEGNGQNCIACLEGFTSDMGQKCRPCSNNTFGERCRGECFCSNYEKCDHVKGCVASSTTYGISVHETSSDRPLTVMTTAATQFGKDNTTWDIPIVSQTEGQNMDNRNGDLLSREIIKYYTFTLIVVVTGIWLCFLVYKYKIVTKKKKVIITHPQNPPILNIIPNIEIEESLYDNIDDTDMLGFIEQTEHSHDHLGVISGSNSTGRGEHTSFCEEGQYERNNDNIIQRGIKTAPSEIREYLTQATVHRIDCSLTDNEKSTNLEHECIPQRLNAQKTDTLNLPHKYEIFPINVRYIVPERCFLNKPERISRSCNNLNNEFVKVNICSRLYDQNTKSAVENRLASYNISKTKSESDIFCNHDVNKN